MCSQPELSAEMGWAMSPLVLQDRSMGKTGAAGEDVGIKGAIACAQRLGACASGLASVQVRLLVLVEKERMDRSCC